MKTIDPALLEKYFTRQCTPQEVELVLGWFRTPEGMSYLEQRMDDEIQGRLFRAEQTGPEISERLYATIQKRIQTLRLPHHQEMKRGAMLIKSGKSSAFYLKTAAAVLIMIFTSTLYWMATKREGFDQAVLPVYTLYNAELGQHKLLTLGDGTVVRLNENSTLMLNDEYGIGHRRVELTGEAYFDVKPNSDLPFEVKAGDGVVQVLGTRFNVKVEYKHPKGNLEG